MSDTIIRSATPADAEALHALIAAHQTEGHLLPRPLEEVRRHTPGFVVADVGGNLAACAELVPLSGARAEIRSLVVAEPFRRGGLAARLFGELRKRAVTSGFRELAAFTHNARFFVKQGFSMVPHLWVPEKIAKDCQACSLFRACGQQAMVLDLTAVESQKAAVVFRPRHAAVA